MTDIEMLAVSPYTDRILAAVQRKDCADPLYQILQDYARAVAEHNVSRALAESDHSLRTENAGLALALEQAETNVKARDAEIEELRAEVERLGADSRMQAHMMELVQARAERAEAEAEAEALRVRADRLAEALRWYAEQAELCRKLGAAGDSGRRALDADGGKRARAALRDHDQEGKDG